MVNILVDSGSTYNFIKPSVATSLNLCRINIPYFKFFVGSGDFIWCHSKCINIDIIVQGVSFKIDLYHLDISAADIVCGMTWLKSLGRVLTDYNLLTMEFVYHDQPITLYTEKLLQDVL